MKLIKGDNIESLKTLEDNSIDSIVTDPPYGLKFMGKKWDYDVPTIEFWKEVYRVLKPGGHILSFGGTRTYHRMVVNIEDAGFEIRDQIQWIYGSGFPKSLNIGKAVDKIQGNEREIIGQRIADDITGGNLLTSKPDKKIDITKGTSPYEGLGTALKPANEPICVARKPISEKTIAENVMKWGTGVINIDGCRIGSEGGTMKVDIEKVGELNEGRFPANIIFDEEAGNMLNEQSGIVNQGHWPKGSTKGFGEFGGGESSYEGVGYKDKTKSGASRFFYCAKVSKSERNMGLDGFEDKLQAGAEFRPNHMEKALNGEDGNPYGRYTPTKNIHPTVKPINLMTYLCRLVTPKGGVVLDPFMGSGSTGISARLEGFDFIGMEMDEEYFKISESRINNFEKYRKFLKK